MRFATHKGTRFVALAAIGAVAAAVAGGASGPGSEAQAAEATQSFFSGSTTPATDSDRAAVELGVKFSTTVSGSVIGVHVYRPSGSAARTATLWSATGTALATATLPSTGSGWLKATFASPVAIPAGRTFVASYFTPNGRYAATVNGYTRARSVGDLRAPVSAGVYTYRGSSAFPTSTYRSSDYAVSPLFVAGGRTPSTSPRPSPSATRTPTATPSPTATRTPTTTPTPTVTATPTATPTPSSTPGAWPGPSNTGVPAGTSLTAYTGPCTLTTANTVISGKTVNCDLVIRAANIQVRNSKVTGRIVSNTSGASVTVTDSSIDGGQQETFPTVSYQGITLLRVNVTGGQHSVQCSGTCTITDSWLHGQYLPRNSAGHVNAFISNGGGGFTLTHNTLDCTAEPTASGGCTADASLFGDFGPINGATLTNNLFVAEHAGYCLQAGFNPSKRFPNPSNVLIKNNVFQRGANGKCGLFGPVTAFKKDGPGNVFSGNVFDDGTPINL